MTTNRTFLSTNTPAKQSATGSNGGSGRFLGLDIGAETVKVVELSSRNGIIQVMRTEIAEHGKEPIKCLLKILARMDWSSVDGAAVCGRMGRPVALQHMPIKQAQMYGYRHFFGRKPGTIVSIGSHGFSVLEMRDIGLEVFRENGRCSQGTGNFLRQLVGRFSLDVHQASELCADVEDPAPLSGRCPVILKTDMTHLANKGENQAQILAGLFDAVCENVMALIKPGLNPPDVYLIGGVSRSRRVRNTFSQLLGGSNMSMMPLEEDKALFLEATGAAMLAIEERKPVPDLDRLCRELEAVEFDRVAPLGDALSKVRRMPVPAHIMRNGEPANLILGFDIGSTGSKLVSLDADAREIQWEGYRNTSGDPVGAAQALLQQFLDKNDRPDRVLAMGVTGSGREIVGSLMSTCYGKDCVFILNEIAAHAEGAMRYDKRVDTIFEIGGQDAKYIRLAGGRVIDCAMNEACSAGTGSFIEEQGKKFPGVKDVVHLGQEAVEAPCGVSLGQHCSVFMAEIIDQAVDAGVHSREIIAGLYDSIIQNYLHRVKGNRSVGQVIFCQGMPFSADALAAAVARQTGSEVIIPPNPGTVGALGIALLAEHELPWKELNSLDPHRFLHAEILQKSTFNCKANVGCGGAGNKCRIDTIRTLVDSKKQRFTWGGGCSLYDKGTRKKKLPNLAPDPFREREGIIRELLDDLAGETAPGSPRVALTDEFILKGLFPFYSTFIAKLGFELVTPPGADQKMLKRGVQESNLSYCAPMQLYHGLAGSMAEKDCDYMFAPMIRTTPHGDSNMHSKVCPIAQACPDIIRWDLGDNLQAQFVSPVIDIGKGDLDSDVFIDGCRRTALEFGIKGDLWRAAYRAGVASQLAFEKVCLDLGRRTLAFCRENDIVPVVVLGRPYTIYNKVLNSNVPALLREQGSIGIPVDCYPLDGDVPVFKDIYWGYAQRILRTAQHVRKEPGVYSLFCSNYSCGPDSFSLHFFSHIMEGKPFAILETDGHSGDAGTKTRIEAFLHCVNQDRMGNASFGEVHDFSSMKIREFILEDIPREKTILVPNMNVNSRVVTAAMRGMGYKAEGLPMPDPQNLRHGRRHTSGKECVPMTLTLGSLLQKLQSLRGDEGQFVLFLPRTPGPCRFGVYNLLNNITMDRLGLQNRIDILSPAEHNYFANAPASFLAICFSGFMAADLLRAALHDTRHCEYRPGSAQAIHDRYADQLENLCEAELKGDVSGKRVLREVASGRLFGIPGLLREAANDFAALKQPMSKPTVLVVGEFYVRCVPFANDFVIQKLEERGCIAKLAPVNEWLEYVDHVNRFKRRITGLAGHVKGSLQAHIRRRTYGIMANVLGWPEQAPIEKCLEAARPYLRDALEGEAVVTLGSSIVEWREGHIDAAVSVGPLECMPNKVAEAQFFHVAEREGLPNLTIPLMGDPMNLSPLDNFTFEVKKRYEEKNGLAVT